MRPGCRVRFRLRRRSGFRLLRKKARPTCSRFQPTTILTASTEEFDSVLVDVFSADGRQLMDGNRVGGVFRAPSVGTYYLRVSPLSTEFPPNYYSVEIQVSENDTNDTAVSADEWDISKPLSSDLSAEGDVEYFKFQATEGQTYVFNVDNPRLVMLLDSDGKTELSQFAVLDGVDEGESDPVVYGSWTAPASGTYFIKVSGYSSMAVSGLTGPYTLTAVAAPDNLCIDQPRWIVAGKVPARKGRRGGGGEGSVGEGGRGGWLPYQ